VNDSITIVTKNW